MTTSEERYRKGMEKRRELWGPVPVRSRGAADDLAPDFGRMVDEYLFGGIWGRPGLDIKSRSMCTMAMLTVLGKEPQLRHHVKGALNIGMTKEQIVEVLLHAAFYGGLPAALNALNVAKEVFDEAKL